MSRRLQIGHSNIARFLAAHVLCVVFCSCRVSPTPQSFSTLSPQNIYEVKFQERPEKQTDFFSSQETYSYDVYFFVKKEGHSFIPDTKLSSKKIWSQRLNDAYPSRVWLSNNILRLSGKPLPLQSQCDEISIFNNTDDVTPYIKVSTSTETYILLNLQPHSTTILLAEPQTDIGADYSWVGAECLFNNGSKIGGEENFRVKGKYKGSAHYSITINKQAIVVSSKEFIDQMMTVSGDDKKSATKE